MKIAILNGPNLNMLGQRDPGLYGTTTLAEIETLCTRRCATHGFDLDFFQSNCEGALVDKVHASRDCAALIINAGAYTHTSIALHDALQLIAAPILELHLSNIHRRESFRRRSYISLVATGLIVGLGANGYGLAIDAVADLLATRASSGGSANHRETEHEQV